MLKFVLVLLNVRVCVCVFCHIYPVLFNLQKFVLPSPPAPRKSDTFTVRASWRFFSIKNWLMWKANNTLEMQYFCGPVRVLNVLNFHSVVGSHLVSNSYDRWESKLWCVSSFKYFTINLILCIKIGLKYKAKHGWLNNYIFFKLGIPWIQNVYTVNIFVAVAWFSSKNVSYWKAS